MNSCPCGSGRDFAVCCEPILAGAPAETAEALMRSRYTAYVKRAYDHLERSLSAEQRKDYSAENAKQWAEKSEWLGLTILHTEAGGASDEQGVVEFSAKYRIGDQPQEHVEIATFGRENGRWVYTGHRESAGHTVKYDKPKPGRNDPCPCGSGKKYKKCCGAAS